MVPKTRRAIRLTPPVVAAQMDAAQKAFASGNAGEAVTLVKGLVQKPQIKNLHNPRVFGRMNWKVLDANPELKQRALNYARAHLEDLGKEQVHIGDISHDATPETRGAFAIVAAFGGREDQELCNRLLKKTGFSAGGTLAEHTSNHIEGRERRQIRIRIYKARPGYVPFMHGQLLETIRRGKSMAEINEAFADLKKTEWWKKKTMQVLRKSEHIAAEAAIAKEKGESYFYKAGRAKAFRHNEAANTRLPWPRRVHAAEAILWQAIATSTKFNFQERLQALILDPDKVVQRLARESLDPQVKASKERQNEEDYFKTSLKWIRTGESNPDAIYRHIAELPPPKQRNFFIKLKERMGTRFLQKPFMMPVDVALDVIPLLEMDVDSYQHRDLERLIGTSVLFERKEGYASPGFFRGLLPREFGGDFKKTGLVSFDRRKALGALRYELSKTLPNERLRRRYLGNVIQSVKATTRVPIEFKESLDAMIERTPLDVFERRAPLPVRQNPEQGKQYPTQRPPEEPPAKEIYDIPF
ncbi:Uncharacterised protein [uncultured archaeon]|nr:Uncharacterised protein [uncultured archaeon]